MNLSKVIGILLIVVSLGVGYIGINKLADSTKQINFLGLKIDASNESGQTQGVIYMGVAIVLFVGGIYATRSKG